MEEPVPTLASLPAVLRSSAACTDEEPDRAEGTCSFDCPSTSSFQGPCCRCPDNRPCLIHARSYCFAHVEDVVSDAGKEKDVKGGGVRTGYTEADLDVVARWEIDGVAVGAGPRGSRAVRSHMVILAMGQIDRKVGLLIAHGWRQNAWAAVVWEIERVDYSRGGLAGSRLDSSIATVDWSKLSIAQGLAYCCQMSLEATAILDSPPGSVRRLIARALRPASHAS